MGAMIPTGTTADCNVPDGTLLLTRRDVSRLLTLEQCLVAVEHAFKLHGAGSVPPPAVLGINAESGVFHVKAAALPLDRLYFAAKINANFPPNSNRNGLPTIQGMIGLFDGSSGYPLALMDSIEITIMRTGAATAVAARYLARQDAQIATICGCGEQGRIQLQAISQVRKLSRVNLFDIDPQQAHRLAKEMATDVHVEVCGVSDLASAVSVSDICITCTPSKRHFIKRDWIRAGAFVAAVGADNADKQEIDPELLAASKVVTDVREQCAAIGELHHAIVAGLMNSQDVHSELGEVVAGIKPGRTTGEEIIVFDSTGTALQDAAAAATVYKAARSAGCGLVIKLND
jgi:alanine dehydrogenase